MNVDKDFCCSSYLVFREVVKDMNFSENIKGQKYSSYGHGKPRYDVTSIEDVEEHIQKKIDEVQNKKTGLLLSGGMDSGLLASFLRGLDAYTFRFLNGSYANDELKRAEHFAKINDMCLHYVDIDWQSIDGCIDTLMTSKGSPIHSIEPQVFLASEKAKKDGIETMIIGDGADYVFGGMDKLLSQEWTFDEFVDRYTYLDPILALKEPVSMRPIFEEYRLDGEKIDYMKIMFDTLCPDESYESYANAFHASKMNYIDPYADLHVIPSIDIQRIRSGESKYMIRELFKKRYNFDPPEKVPMPRPVDLYFEDWGGPKRDEFLDNLDMKKFSGNQKWQLYCLERFLNLMDKRI